MANKKVRICRTFDKKSANVKSKAHFCFFFAAHLLGKDQHRSLHLTRCPWPHQASKRRESTRLCSITILFTWLLPLLPLYFLFLRHYTECNRFTLQPQMEDQLKEKEGKKDIWSCVIKYLDYYQNVKNLICTNKSNNTIINV